MKKKIINGLLFAAALVVASSSFVSCKDYEGDNYAKLEEQQITIWQLYSDQTDAIRKYLGGSENADLLSLWELAGKTSLNDRVIALEDFTSNKNNKFDEAVAGAIKDQAVIDALKEFLKSGDGAQTIIQMLGSTGDDGLKQTITNMIIEQIELNNEAIIKAVNDALATKNYLTEEQVNALILAKGYLTEAQVLELLKDKTTLTLEDVKKYLTDNGYATTSDIEKLLADKGYATEQWVKDQKYLTAADVANFITMEDVNAQGFAKNSDLLTLKDQVKGISDNLATALSTSSYALQLAKLDSARIDGLDKTTADALALAKQDSIRIDALKQEAEANFKEAKHLADSALTIIASWGDVPQQLTDLEAAYKAADAQLQTQIDNLNDRVNKNAQDITSILGSLKKQISGIIIQGSYNPIIGRLSMPLDIDSKILAAFYGRFDGNVEFPTTIDNYFVEGASLVSPAEMAATGIQSQIFGAGLQINETDDNAGHLYLTVNPAGIDFTGTEFSLRTSDNKVSKVLLSSIKPCTEQLKFGYTRTGIEETSTNGFYVANAKIAKEDIGAVTPNMDLHAMREALVNIKNNWRQFPKGIDFSDVARAIYKNTHDVLPRLAVQANWYDDASKGYRSVSSELGLAATAIKPLGFDFMAGDKWKNRTWIQQIGKTRINNEIAELMAFELGLKFNVNITVPQLTPINIHFDGNAVKIHLTKGQFGEVKGMVDNPDFDETKPIDDETNPKYVEKIVKIPDADCDVEITDIVSKIYGDLEGSIQGFNEAIPQFQKLGEDLNTQLGGIEKQVNDAVNNLSKNLTTRVQNFLGGYIDRINNYIKKANSLLNNVNAYVQPIMIGFGNASEKPDTYYRLTERPEFAISVTGKSMILYPTTFTLETAVPAYKKWVAVTNVMTEVDANAKDFDARYLDAINDGDATLKGYMDAANDGKVMNKVINGANFNWYAPETMYALNFGNAPSGTIFEIAYQALGYNGKIAQRKYYVKVK